MQEHLEVSGDERTLQCGHLVKGRRQRCWKAWVLRYCRNVHPTWVKFDSKDTKESGSGSGSRF